MVKIFAFLDLVKNISFLDGHKLVSLMEKVKADILIIGMGGAAQLAALNAYDANPDLDILIVTKALRGKGGCSRMV
ncbi:MAG: hypothetical protein JRG79_16750, partial [Deltaproteobacteria bacterium]|nr:hypothetical protein [Deltaproteobacteria bacterium]